MGKMHIGLFFDTGKVVTGVVVVTGESITTATPIGVDQSSDRAVLADTFQITPDAKRRLLWLWLCAGEKEHLVIIDTPYFCGLSDKIQP
jgi:hypothetical protein